MNKVLKAVIIVIAVILLLVFIILATGTIIFRGRVHSEIARLFIDSEDISDRVFGYDQLGILPEPVQRYFKYAMPAEMEYISYARLKHTGTFRTKAGRKWMPISGEQYFTTQRPGFVWYAKLKPFPLFWIAARDMHFKGQGNVLVKLLSTFTIGDSKGKEVNQSSLLRFIGECVWFPTALLPSDYLQWEAIDSNSARVIVSDSRIDVSGIFHFNEAGEITHFTADRYMDTTKEKWTGYCKSYKEFDGVKIPTEIEAVWNLKSGDFSYARFKITQIEFNNPSFYR